MGGLKVIIELVNSELDAISENFDFGEKYNKEEIVFI